MFTGARAQFRNATKWANLQFVTDEHATIGDVLDTTINQCGTRPSQVFALKIRHDTRIR
jgi:hypothetical protein